MTVIEGSCEEAMRELDEASVDAIVCDPPYGLEFMGKEWDRFRVDDPGTQRHRGERAGVHGELISEPSREPGAHPARNKSGVGYGGGKRPTTNRCVGCGKRDQFRNAHGCPEGTEWRKELIDPHSAPPTMLAFQEWSRLWALEAKRVLKPGGHLLAFGGTRTYHRLACAVEDAGFEIRDSLIWLYGSGFPKSLDVSKAIDKAAGAEREVVGKGVTGVSFADPGERGFGSGTMETDITAPATPEAAQWEGWGTALKPSHEPIVVARKPLEGTVAANVLEYGTGGLNVDGCRIGTTGGGNVCPGGDACECDTDGRAYSPTKHPVRREGDFGRWPSNCVLSHLPECVEVGVRKVKGDSRDTGAGTRPGGFADVGAATGDGEPNAPVYGNEDGTETIPAFECAPGCPISALDAGDKSPSRFFYTAKSSRSERTAGVGANAHPT